MPTLVNTLPGRYYTDPAGFAREQEAVFERMWCCAVRADDLATPGRFRTVHIGRESVLITRDRTGALHAFLNVSGTAAPCSAPRRRVRCGAPSAARTTPGPTPSTAGSPPHRT